MTYYYIYVLNKGSWNIFGTCFDGYDFNFFAINKFAHKKTRLFLT